MNEGLERFEDATFVPTVPGRRLGKSTKFSMQLVAIDIQ